MNTYFEAMAWAPNLDRLQDGTIRIRGRHNLAIDEFCWGALWMDVDNDRPDLFVPSTIFVPMESSSPRENEASF